MFHQEPSPKSIAFTFMIIIYGSKIVFKVQTYYGPVDDGLICLKPISGGIEFLRLTFPFNLTEILKELDSIFPIKCQEYYNRILETKMKWLENG